MPEPGSGSSSCIRSWPRGLQTMDLGHPVSPCTVMGELGHSSLSLVEKTCGHLLEVGHRSPVVAYREPRVVPFPQQAEGA